MIDIDNMRTSLTVFEKDMDEWKDICNAYTKKKNAKLVFTNANGCGLEYEDGQMIHVSIESMIEDLKEV